MSHDTTDLIVELTIVGILFVVLIVTMTLLILKGQGDCKSTALDIEAPDNTITS